MKQRKIVSFSLIFALILGMLIAPNQADAKKKKKVALNKTKLTLTVGKSYKLKLKNNKKKIKWSSSKKKVATVSKTGKVKAKKAGTTRITAKVGKKKYVCKVTVKNKKKTTKTTKTTSTKKPTVTKAPANNTTTTKATPSPTPYVAAQSFTLSGCPSEIELVGDDDYEIYGLDVKVSPSNATEKVKFTFSDDDLAKVDDDRLMKLWEGLGYYNRARNLKAAAQTIVEEYGGQLPADYDKLLSLKGIGMYTAGAIGSIAFELQVPAVDGNVLRVLTRLWGDDSDILKDKTKKAMGRRVMEFMPEDRPGDFNQALIELGATVCVPNGQPLCDQCPWDTVCKAYKEDLIDQLPVKTPKKARRIEHKTVFLLECGEQVAIHKRGDKGLLAGLWEFPNEDKKMDAEDIKEWMAEHHMEDAKTKAAGKGKHIFSHVEWHMEGVRISLKTPIQSENYVWVLKKELENTYALPSAFEIFRKIL